MNGNSYKEKWTIRNQIYVPNNIQTKNWQDHVPSTLVVSVSVALVFGQGFCVYQNEVELYQSILYNSLSPSPSLLYYLDQNVPVCINIKLIYDLSLKFK